MVFLRRVPMKIIRKLMVFSFFFVLTVTSIYAEAPKAKYVFLFIGDGMGVSEVNATEGYRAAIEGKIGIKKLSFTQFPVLGLATTYAKDRYITDSAAAGTALATGNKTAVETIAMDGARKRPLKSIAKMAQEKGMKIGIITTANMNDATPSAFYAHEPERNMYKEITAELVKSDIDLFSGGGLKKGDATAELKKNGYKLVSTRKAFNDLKPGVKKVFATCPRLDDEMSCPFAIDQKQSDIKLSEFTKKAIDLLESPKGFFMMIEAGKIDWANHGNDAATAIKDVLALDDAVKVAVKFYDKHPKDTLIVVTSDHETGGFAQGSKEMGYDTDFKKLDRQKVSSDAVNNKIKGCKKFADIKPYIKENFGFWTKNGFKLTAAEDNALEDAFLKSVGTTAGPKDVYALSSEITRMFDSKVGIGWTTNKHTGMPVAVFAKGEGAELFKGYIDNTDVAKNIMKIMELK